MVWIRYRAAGHGGPDHGRVLGPPGVCVCERERERERERGRERGRERLRERQRKCVCERERERVGERERERERERSINLHLLEAFPTFLNWAVRMEQASGSKGNWATLSRVTHIVRSE